MKRASTAVGAALTVLLAGCGPPIAVDPGTASSAPAGPVAATPVPSATSMLTPTASSTAAPTETAAPTPTPTPDPCDLPVYESEPREPFDLLGIVEVKRRSPGERAESILESAKTAACRMGGSAIVILHRASPRQGGIAARPAPRGVLLDADLRAAVIRFR